MKRKIKLTLYIVIMAFCIMSNFVNAQWIVGPSFNNFGQTDVGNNIESIGIGDFATPGLYPLSSLHINTNLLGYLLNPPTYQLGEVFRTTAGIPDGGDISTFWRM